MLKAGPSASGAKTAFSHTGAIVGAFEVDEAAFRRKLPKAPLLPH